MPDRRPQINFQVDRALKRLYEETKEQGHWVTRFCAAGFLLMVEDPAARAQAISRLREWEAEYSNASPKEIRAFVEGAQAAMQRGLPGSPPARPARPAKKRAKRS
jgi:hypothetical protein